MQRKVLTASRESSIFHEVWLRNVNLHFKIRTEGTSFWTYLGIFRDYSLKVFFLGIKLFCFQDRKLKFLASVWKRSSWNLMKFELIELIQTIFISIFSICCLIELKFCEVSRNSFLNRCWKFQLSILKNKKALFLKNI